VDSDKIYITIRKQNQIFVYTDYGTLRKTIGTEFASGKKGEFNQPLGLTLDNTSLYVCDHGNHYLQVLSKDNNNKYLARWGKFGTGEGEFNYPFAVYLGEDEIFYIGDYFSVQLFNKGGVFLQRLGQKLGWEEGSFNHVCGICVVNELLYVSDYDNFRVQIFRKKA